LNTTTKQPQVEPLPTAGQVAEWLGYSDDTIHRLCRDEGLPYRRMAGNRKRFVRADVQEWLDGRRVVARAAQPAAVDGPGRPTAPATPGESDWRERFRRFGS
jgi:excisionase family DNA binding protein